MARPRLLDAFCGAGGAACGYVRAGFDVTGIDHVVQPRYLLSGASAFVLADALEYVAAHGHEYDAIHASPPCQAYSSLRTRWQGRRHPELIVPAREALRATGRPYVIENVMGAPLRPAVLLCGSAFGLGVRRHRLFETSHLLFQPECRHALQGVAMGVYGHPGGCPSSERKGKGRKGSTGEWAAAMGIGWMAAAELSQAVPPAYTEFVGRQLLNVIGGRP